MVFSKLGRDLGCHRDTTFRGWSATFATRFRLVITKLLLVTVVLSGVLRGVVSVPHVEAVSSLCL